MIKADDYQGEMSAYHSGFANESHFPISIRAVKSDRRIKFHIGILNQERVVII